MAEFSFKPYLQSLKGNVEAISRTPKPPHLDWIREYYSLHLGEDVPAAPRTVIDDCCYDLIFYREGNGRLVFGPHGQALALPAGAFTIHNLPPPFRFDFQPPLTFFTLKLQPWVNGHYFRDLQAPGVYGLSESHPGISAWFPRIFQAESQEERFTVADALLDAHAPVLGAATLRVRAICEAIYAAGGRIEVGALSEQFDISRQHLARIFKKEVLYSLKHFILTVRMMNLVKHHLKAPGESLTELAHRFEYFDQSHFIRDFQKFCGSTPSEFFRSPPEFMERH